MRCQRAIAIKLPHFKNNQDKKKTVWNLFSQFRLLVPLRAKWELSGLVWGQLGYLGPSYGVFRSLWGSMNMNWCVSGLHFVSLSCPPPNIAQKWFCIQTLRMDLSFQEKKLIDNLIIGCRDIKQKPSLFFWNTLYLVE